MEDHKRAERALKDAEDDWKQDPGEIPPDREKDFGSGLLSRMKTSWTGEDAHTVALVRKQAEIDIRTIFRDAFGIMIDVYLEVRQPKVDSDGSLILDENGLEPLWEEDGFGKIIENWNLLTDKKREQFIMEIVTVMVRTEQKAADLWGESQLAKAKWEDTFVEGFLRSKGTNDARTNEGKAGAREDRYFAIYKSWVSRKADALVRSLERLCQRLKDIG